MFDYFLKKTLMVSILYRVQLSRSFGNTTRTHASLDHQLTKKSLDGWTYEWNTYPPSGFNAYLLFIILYPFFFPLDLATFLRWYVQHSSQQQITNKPQGKLNDQKSIHRPGREWRAIARAHAHTRHILFSCAIIARLNFV